MQKIFAIFLVITVLNCSTFAQQINNADNECGILNENYLYNFKGTAAADEFPWLGRVYYLNDDGSENHNYRCQAVLISRRHLVTTAGCFSATPDKYRNTYAVILGNDDQCYQNSTCPSPVPNYYEIDEIAIHPNITYDRRNRFIIGNNIAILTLKLDVTFNTEVRPICLPSDAESNAHYVGQYLQYAGYAKRSVKPLKAVAHVASMAKCVDLYKGYILQDEDLCVIADMKEETLFGAGAPLMGVTTGNLTPYPHPEKFYLIGLAALGRPNYVPGAMDVVLRIGSYMKWIRDKVAV